MLFWSSGSEGLDQPTLVMCIETACIKDSWLVRSRISPCIPVPQVAMDQTGVNLPPPSLQRPQKSRKNFGNGEISQTSKLLLMTLSFKLVVKHELQVAGEAFFPSIALGGILGKSSLVCSHWESKPST